MKDISIMKLKSNEKNNRIKSKDLPQGVMTVQNKGADGQMLLVTMDEVSPYNISRLRELVTNT